MFVIVAHPAETFRATPPRSANFQDTINWVEHAGAVLQRAGWSRPDIATWQSTTFLLSRAYLLQTLRERRS